MLVVVVGDVVSIGVHRYGNASPMFDGPRVSDRRRRRLWQAGGANEGRNVHFGRLRT
jgi:hypothetical protein